MGSPRVLISSDDARGAVTCPICWKVLATFGPGYIDGNGETMMLMSVEAFGEIAATEVEHVVTEHTLGFKPGHDPRKPDFRSGVDTVHGPSLMSVDDLMKLISDLRNS